VSDDYYYKEEFVDQVKHNNDLLDLAGEYTELKKRGKNYMGLCPFHQEDTPSFSVDPDKQLYYCFGCGAGGNIFNFIMEIEGLTFVEAIKYLADRAHLDLPNRNLSAEERKKRSEKQKLYEIHKLATRFYVYLLTESNLGDQGYQYLQERGFSSEVIHKFKLGFAPDRWEQLYKFLKKKDYSDQILSKSGLVIARNNASGYYDRFRNRVMFSIFNHRGQPIGFGGRVLAADEEPKYLNSPETMIFDKSQTLYGLHLTKSFIREQEIAIMMEGYTDVITAYQMGVKNVVASLGTSLTTRQANLLARYADKVYIAYDADAAGEQATWRGLNILRQAGLQVEVIELPQEQDPDDFLQQEGKEGFKTLMSEAVPLLEFKINSVLPDNNEFVDVDSKINAFRKTVPVLSQVEDEVERGEYLQYVAEKLGIKKESITSLQKEVNRYKRNQRQKSNNNQDNKNDWGNNNNLKEELSSSQLAYKRAVEAVIKIIIDQPRYIPQIRESLLIEDFKQEKYKRLFSLLCDFYEQDKKIEVDRLLTAIKSEEVEELVVKLSVEGVVSDDLDRELADSINRIKEYQLKMKLEDLETKIKQAEAEGDNEQLRELLQDYSQYQNQLRKEGN